MKAGPDPIHTARGMSPERFTKSACRRMLRAMAESARHPCDPRGLIHEAYRIEDIGPEDCRAIFFDWAVGLDQELDPAAAARQLHDELAPAHPEHPMTALLAEAAHDVTPERGQARGRRRRH